MIINYFLKKNIIIVSDFWNIEHVVKFEKRKCDLTKNLTSGLL